MESAIPKHLRCPRTQARRAPEGYQPPFPARSARYQPSVQQLVMAHFGVQAQAASACRPAWTWLVEAMSVPDRPDHWEAATFVDTAGFTNLLLTAYWRDPVAYQRWWHTLGCAWTEGDHWGEGVGTYAEVLQPTVQRFETLFSSNRPEGVARLADGLSGDITEHGYWGSMRDRLPAAQTDALVGARAPTVEDLGNGLVRVQPVDNLCLIRSGQDWSDTSAQERQQYLRDVEPVLRQGMDFLSQQGQEVGCLANRYLRVLDARGEPIEKSFGLSWWRDLGALETWAQSHPTHVAIFGAAMAYLGSLGPSAQLKLFHEVTVTEARQQQFSYRHCHPRTGLLQTLVSAPRTPTEQE
ncbi:phenylacetaldoxime dehydratase family protein [Aquabacterium sp.]|uniref:phenylacetaldoxime dehydratase family protein n=1 Tax=Aquabacterium sp. TaxID=1872578 RepID=UPI0025C46A92|nr:phenylacetaldoxime dehydratase family protein [Aquabacterium sp.]